MAGCQPSVFDARADANLFQRGLFVMTPKSRRSTHLIGRCSRRFVGDGLESGYSLSPAPCGGVRLWSVGRRGTPSHTHIPGSLGGVLMSARKQSGSQGAWCLNDKRGRGRPLETGTGGSGASSFVPPDRNYLLRAGTSGMDSPRKDASAIEYRTAKSSTRESR